MKVNLVVADPERSSTTICLAVSPAMKELGVPGRCRVFEIPAGIDYIMAVPRMQRYIDCSAEIYEIYLRYIAREDIHVYSIDEVFMDVTDYLTMYGMTARELAVTIMKDIFENTGITATAGIGTNLYLAKVALDITAKHVEDHIGVLNEEVYRMSLWDHRPLTDFWRIGKGTADRLEQVGIATMRGIADADEKMLYRMFGMDAELLIDHAWGREPVTMADIKAYRPRSSSLSGGQVLPRDYSFEEGRLVLKEMADVLSLELVEKGLLTDSVSLYVGYSNRLEKNAAHGTAAMTSPTSSSRRIMASAVDLYDRIVDRHTAIRRINLSFNRVAEKSYEQYDLFSNPEELDRTLRRVKKNDVIEVIYYSCGEYRKITGTVVRVDRSAGLFQVDESEIPVKDICQIRCQASNHKKESGEAAV